MTDDDLVVVAEENLNRGRLDYLRLASGEVVFLVKFDEFDIWLGSIPADRYKEAQQAIETIESINSSTPLLLSHSICLTTIGFPATLIKGLGKLSVKGLRRLP